jgi:hypothetical protein
MKRELNNLRSRKGSSKKQQIVKPATTIENKNKNKKRTLDEEPIEKYDDKEYQEEEVIILGVDYSDIEDDQMIENDIPADYYEDNAEILKSEIGFYSTPHSQDYRDITYYTLKNIQMQCASDYNLYCAPENSISSLSFETFSIFNELSAIFQSNELFIPSSISVIVDDDNVDADDTAEIYFENSRSKRMLHGINGVAKVRNISKRILSPFESISSLLFPKEKEAVKKDFLKNSIPIEKGKMSIRPVSKFQHGGVRDDGGSNEAISVTQDQNLPFNTMSKFMRKKYLGSENFQGDKESERSIRPGQNGHGVRLPPKMDTMEHPDIPIVVPSHSILPPKKMDRLGQDGHGIFNPLPHIDPVSPPKFEEIGRVGQDGHGIFNPLPHIDPISPPVAEKNMKKFEDIDSTLARGRPGHGVRKPPRKLWDHIHGHHGSHDSDSDGEDDNHQHGSGCKHRVPKDDLFAGSIGYGEYGDSCIYQNIDNLSQPCFNAVQDLYVLREQYWEEEQQIQNHQHGHFFVLLMFFLLISAMIRKCIYHKRNKKVESLLKVINANPSLKSSLEAEIGSSLPKVTSSCKERCIRLFYGLFIMIASFMSLIFIFFALVIGVSIGHAILFGDNESDSFLGATGMILLMITSVSIVLVLIGKISRRLRRSQIEQQQGSYAQTGTGSSAPPSNDDDSVPSNGLNSLSKVYHRVLNIFRTSSAPSFLSPPNGYTPLLGDETEMVSSPVRSSNESPQSSTMIYSQGVPMSAGQGEVYLPVQARPVSSIHMI